METTTSRVQANETELPVYYPDIKQPVFMIVIYTVAYSLVFLLGIVGNSLVVGVVYRNPTMHSVTNYFIVNLAIADILVVVFCLPVTLVSNIYTEWRFGPVLCKLIPYLQGISVNASVNTLAVIAFDRYMAICHVMHFGTTRKMARIIIGLIWLCAATIMAPWLVYYKQVHQGNDQQKLYICGDVWPSEDVKKWYFFGVIFLFCFTIPLLLITLFYTLISCRVWHRNAPGITNASRVIYQSKIKVLKMMIVVVILFASFWMPLYAVNLRMVFGTKLNEKDPELHFVAQTVIPIVQWLGSSNSCMNPIIYCFFSRKFRVGFADIVRRCARRTSPSLSRSYLSYSVPYDSVHKGGGRQSLCLQNRCINDAAPLREKVRLREVMV